MIVSGGENVFPGEVEEVLAAVPGVREVAVIGVPDDQFGQRLRAFVTLAPGASLTEQELKDMVRSRLAGFKVPREVLVRRRAAAQCDRQDPQAGAGQAPIAGGRSLPSGACPCRLICSIWGRFA